MAKKDYDYQFKLFLIGDSSVGKTSILKKFADETYDANHIATVGIDFKIKTIEVSDKRVQLQVWDTAGQERFHTITQSFYRDAKGILLVYDITNGESFDNIGKWLRNIDERADEGVLKMLIGNKCDLSEKRVVAAERAQEAADRFKIGFLETSAKTDFNIKKAFYDMARQLIENEKAQKPQIPSGTTNLNLKVPKHPQRQTGCCS